MISLVMRTSFVVAAALALGACAPRLVTPPPAPVGLPPVPEATGPLDIRVQWPSAGATRPNVDSTFIFGSVGNGRAQLTINGAPVEVAPNGAFLAFLPMPTSGAWELTAQIGDQVARKTVAYRVPPPPAPRDTVAALRPAPADTAARPATRAPAGPVRTTFARPLTATVIGVSDTLASGSDVAPGYPVPNTDVNRRWFLPRGTRLTAVGRQGNLIQAHFGTGTTAWIEERYVTLGSPTNTAPARVGPVSIQPAPGYVDVRIPANGAPFLVQEDGRTVRLNLYNVTAPTGALNVTGDPLLVGGAWGVDSTGTTQLTLQLAQQMWGYKVFYEQDGTLVFRLRRPPTIDPQQPLRGIRVLVDPGHPPGGAIGPTGLTEAEANLAISLRLAQMLQQRGAEVIMTRTTPAPLASATSVATELGARTDLAVRTNADLMVSPHNNAFGEAQNPFLKYGTEVLYYHPHSRDLAEALQREIADVTRIPNLGARFQNIAVGRVTWMPSVITESLFMMFPQQEAALRDPEFLDRLAAAHVRGIESFLRARAVAP